MVGESPPGVEMSMKKSADADNLSLSSPTKDEGSPNGEEGGGGGTPFTPISFGRLKEVLTDFVQDIVSSEELFPWINVLLIAGVIGCVEYIPAALLGWGIPTRLNWLNKMYVGYGFYAQILCAIATSIGLVGVSAFMGVFLPTTKGSGLPHIIAYLSNGKMPSAGHFSITTILGKIISVCTAIGGGLAIGREGPAIHIGAALGAITNDYIDKVKALVTGKQAAYDGVIKSNVVMMGSAAGFASAFRAPIGGFMYIVEELAIHWNIEEHTMVGAHMFFAVAIASFITNSIVQATSDAGTINFNSIIIYDHSTSEVYTDVYKYNDIPWFLLLAGLCGIFGGLYTRAAIAINTLRAGNRFYKHWYVRVADCMVVAAITATILCSLPAMYSTCEKNPDYSYSSSSYSDDHRRLSSPSPFWPDAGRRLGGTASNRNYNQYSCDDSYYSPMASLSLSGEEAVIRHLLSRDSENFGLPTLVMFLVFYVPLTLIVMGLPVSCGTFVPNLLLGSLLGRIMGEVASASNDTVSVPGIYALLGAGALLGAWTRTMLAITITIVEISGDVGIVLPLIVCTIIARGIANHVAHHSYTHHNFYRLLDAMEGESGFRHPNDWAPVVAEPVKDGDYAKEGSPGGSAKGDRVANEGSQLDGQVSVKYVKPRRRSTGGEEGVSLAPTFDAVSSIEEGAGAGAGRRASLRAPAGGNFDETLNEPLVVD